MLVKTYSAAVNGLEVTTVTVEISLMRGVMFHLSGLADAAVKEATTESLPLFRTTDISFL